MIKEKAERIVRDKHGDLIEKLQDLEERVLEEISNHKYEWEEE
jgi:hypothetical protein